MGTAGTNPHPSLKKPAAALRTAALALPEAWEDFPWGDQAFKVGKKVFAFMHANQERLAMSIKLPHSADVALNLPFAEPTGYGLGKAGWVSVRFPVGEPVPVPFLVELLHESYRAVAPKKLSKQLDADAAPKATLKNPEPRKRAPKNEQARKQAPRSKTKR
jgi:predicted DNA-binding protein (MmcQ/YjbR family)